MLGVCSIPMKTCPPLPAQVRCPPWQDLIRPSLCKWEWDYRTGQHGVCCGLLEVTAKSLPTPRLSPEWHRENENRVITHTAFIQRNTLHLPFLVIILLLQQHCLLTYIQCIRFSVCRNLKLQSVSFASLSPSLLKTWYCRQVRNYLYYMGCTLARLQCGCI